MLRITIDVHQSNGFLGADGDLDMPTVALNLHEIVRQIANGQREGFLRFEGETAKAITYSMVRIDMWEDE